MRRIINDAVEHFFDWMRKQNPSCEEKVELRERWREEFPVIRRGRKRRFSYEQVQSICKRIVALMNDGKSIAEAEEIVAQELSVKARAIRSVWEHRLEMGWRPEK
jgi:uncharacterized protein YoaH (UPF0181 family)